MSIMPNLRMLIAALLCLVGCANDSVAMTQRRISKVGYLEISFTDGQRNRPLAVMMWYPAVAEAVEKEVTYKNFALGYAAYDAPYLPDGRRAIVLLSHGDKGSNVGQSWLAEALAGNGYIVASVAHWLNTSEHNEPAETLRPWNRPADVSYVLTELLKHPTWGTRIDAQRIGAAGHSAGGYTGLALAGAVFNSKLMDEYCRSPRRGPDCNLSKGVEVRNIDRSGDGRSYKDDRIKAVFAMTPAAGQGVERESLAQIAIPVHIVVAGNDELTLPETNADLYAKYIPSAEITRLESGGHFVFMARCSLMARAITYFMTFDICGRRSGTSRIEVHKKVGDEAERFFSRSLRRVVGRKST